MDVHPPPDFSLHANDLAQLLLESTEDTLCAGTDFQWAPCRYAFIDDQGVQHPSPSNEALKLVVRMERTPPATHNKLQRLIAW